MTISRNSIQVGKGYIFVQHIHTRFFVSIIHSSVGTVVRIYIGSQFFCTSADYPYGRPGDYMENYEIKSFALDGSVSLKELDKWYGTLNLQGVEVVIGDEVSLDRVIEMLNILHAHKIRPYVNVYKQVPGDDIQFREEFLGPVPKAR